MATNRVTTEGLEVLHDGAAQARITTEGLEVLRDGPALARVTSTSLEVLSGGAPANARVTATALEVLSSVAGNYPPTLDGHNKATYSTVSSAAVALTTTLTDDIIVLMVAAEKTTAGAIQVNSVSGGGLTWALRKRLQITGGRHTNPQFLEIWWAHAAATLSAVTITATLSTAIDNGSIIAFGVHGADTISSSPWDTNSSLPAFNSDVTGSTTTPTVSGVSTTSDLDFLISVWSSSTNNGTAGPPAGFTDIEFPQNNGGIDWSFMEAAYETVGSATSITETFTVGRTYWGIIADALKCQSFSPAGTMAITEAPDHFSGVGYTNFPGVWGSLASTETPDVFAGVGYTASLGIMLVAERSDQFSAYGYLPVKGPMIVTEHPDIFHAVGYGAGGVNGTMAVTEARDIFAAVGSGGSINGTFNITEAADRFQFLGAGITQVRHRRPFFVT